MRRLPGFLARCDVFQASSKRLPTFPCIVVARYAARAYNSFAPSACGPRAVRKIAYNARIKTPKRPEQAADGHATFLLLACKQYSMFP